MSTKQRPVFLSSALLTMVMVGGALCPAQDKEKEKELPKTELKADEKLAELKVCLKDKQGAKDPKAIEIIDQLLARVAELDAKQQGIFVKELNTALASAKVKRPPLLVVLVRALGQMGRVKSKSVARRSLNYLQTAYADKRRKFKGKEWIDLRGQMLKQIAESKDKGRVKFILKGINADSDKLKGLAGGVLAAYKDADLKTREDICKTLIDPLINSMSNRNNLKISDTERAVYARRFRAIRDPWTKTLQALTVHKNVTSPAEWQHLKNKKLLFKVPKGEKGEKSEKSQKGKKGQGAR